MPFKIEGPETGLSFKNDIRSEMKFNFEVKNAHSEVQNLPERSLSTFGRPSETPKDLLEGSRSASRALKSDFGGPRGGPGGRCIGGGLVSPRW